MMPPYGITFALYTVVEKGNDPPTPCNCILCNCKWGVKKQPRVRGPQNDAARHAPPGAAV